MKKIIEENGKFIAVEEAVSTHHKFKNVIVDYLQKYVDGYGSSAPEAQDLVKAYTDIINGLKMAIDEDIDGAEVSGHMNTAKALEKLEKRIK